ncbi:MAG: hypothetical protein KKH44_10850 [Bacteroidetes bacterium]|nr:hypothetical protein [Bacteroidota bacterium]
MGGDTTVESPKPSTEETLLMQQQLEILQQQRQESELLKPYILQSVGLVEEFQGEGKNVTETRNVTNPAWIEWKNLYGRISPLSTERIPKEPNRTITETYQKFVPPTSTGYRRLTEEERLSNMTSVERSAYEALGLQQERQIAALKGNLPVSPALETEIEQQKSALNEDLSRRLGSNWQLSTAGTQAMSEFDTKASLLREEARRGEISTGTGLMLSQFGYMNANQQAKQQSYDAYSQRLMPLFAGYGQAQQPYQQYAGLMSNANIANAQAGASESAGMYGAAGAAIGGIAIAI